MVCNFPLLLILKNSDTVILSPSMLIRSFFSFLIFLEPARDGDY